MKRILIFSVAYEPFVGGAEIAVKEITNRFGHPMSKMGNFEFDMVTLNLDGKQMPIEKVGNVTVYRIGGPQKFSKLLFPFTASRFGAKLHAKRPYDAIWSIMASFSGFATLFMKKRLPHLPFILTLQEGDPIDYIKRQVWFVSGWFKQIFTRADRIQTISTFLADFAKNMGATCPIIVIPNGVDLELFNNARDRFQTESQKIRQDLGISEQETVLITTSRLVIKNGIKDVIDTLPLLPNATFLVLGTGPLDKDLKYKVQNLKLEDRVKFLGQINYRNIPHYLALATIFIRPSLSEGMGNSFIEAMAAKIPIIATPVGGIPDFLKDGETGLFCQVHNPKNIAEKVKLLAENRQLREQIIANAHELVVKKYDWNLVAERMKTEIFAKV
jgi:glycosyltransferase involved in cell wall biosynthesis